MDYGYKISHFHGAMHITAKEPMQASDTPAKSLYLVLILMTIWMLVL